MFFFLIKLLIGLVLVVFLLGVWQTWRIEHSENQKVFMAGKAPSPAPDGFYNGTVPSHTVSWLGKKFDSVHNAGINVFDDGGGVKGERYPFKTSYAKGLRDKQTDVLAIDYNMSSNPLWLRLILDEIVEVSPGHYVGKLEVRIFPGFPFTVAYFELKK